MSELQPLITNEDLMDQFLLEEEWRWRDSLPKYSDKELFEIFAPPRDMIKEKLREWEAEHLKKTEIIKEELDNIHSAKIDELTLYFCRQIIRTFLFPEIHKCKKHISQLKRLMRMHDPPIRVKPRGGVTEEEKERARHHPIYEYARDRLALKRVGSKYVAICPFHTEKSPSFYLYPTTNTFYCFGCQESGDVIKLNMHLEDASFIEAIRMLQ